MPLNIFDGSSWNPFKKINVHDGSNWNVAKAAYVWDGTEWKRFSQGVPTNTVIPALSSSTSRFNSLNTLEPGDVLSTDNGTWENSPTSYAYKWYKKIAGSSSWEEILNETNSSITLTENNLPSIKYVGYALRCGVIAKNTVGDSEETFSAETGHVLPYRIYNLTTTVTSNDIVEIVFPKSIGANDYYLQFQGPDYPFTEIMSLANNTNSKVVYDTSHPSNIKITLDLDSADGTLGLLVNPLRVDGSFKHTGYGANGSALNLKPNPAGVSAFASNQSTSGFTFNWSYENGIVPTSWAIYDGAELIANSFTSPLNSTSYSVSRMSSGGTTYGAYYIDVSGSAPRHKQTQWYSPVTVTVTVPQDPTPVNTSAPVVSSSNGRVFTCNPGTWTNSSYIYSYIYDWRSNGGEISFVGDTTLNLGTNTQYDGTQISCNVSILTTDLRTFTALGSNSVTASAYVAPGPDPQLGTVSISQASGNSYSGLLIGSVSSSVGTVTWSWSNGTTSSSYYWSSGDFGQNLILTATATSNGKTVSKSASYQLPDPRQTYYTGTSVCNTSTLSNVYYQSPAVSGPYLTDSSTSYAIPSDTSGGTGIVSKTVYRSTYDGAYQAARQSQCEYVPVFAPPFFPPSFYAPPFAPPFFPPSFGYSSISLKKNIITINN